ncbi:MAG TPA: DUF5317 family protein [Dehalococcoidia bacterium]|nr:DUF5317 family protein [Dehalococcoidia bacterium]
MTDTRRPRDRSESSTLVLSASAALALVILQLLCIRISPWELPVRIVVPMTIAAVPLALWPQRRFLGTWVLFVGVAANLAPVVANGGLMPIERSTIESVLPLDRADRYALDAWIPGSKDVLVTEESGRLVALGDSIAISAGSHGIVASPGDIVLFAGVLMLAGEASVAWQRRSRRDASQEEEEQPEAARGGAITPR